MNPVVIPLDPAISPLDALHCFSDAADVSLLHSAATDHPLGRYSYLSADPVAVLAAGAEQWGDVVAKVRATIRPGPLPADLPPFQGGWVGWIGYEAARAFTRQPRHANGAAPVDDIALALCDWVLAWDHCHHRGWLISTGIDREGGYDARRAARRAAEVAERLRARRVAPRDGPARVAMPARSDFSRDAYCAAVARVIDHIRAGDIFQANLSQRFTATFAGDPVRLYRAICERTPAPMAAYIRHGSAIVAGASPERFLRLDAAQRTVETRPIKGTRPRGTTPERDAALRAELHGSAKDRAENVMIVDVLRNDLSRVCQPGSVRVDALCAVESHPTVHHMVSTITGRLLPGADALDLLAATFPSGSVTGAPKIRAMEIIAAIEPVARGVYTGAIAWIGLDGSMDSCVAIRTTTIAGSVATLHAGGGITALSEPAAEYQETCDKAAALLDALQRFT